GDGAHEDAGAGADEEQVERMGVAVAGDAGVEGDGAVGADAVHHAGEVRERDGRVGGDDVDVEGGGLDGRADRRDDTAGDGGGGEGGGDRRDDTAGDGGGGAGVDEEVQRVARGNRVAADVAVDRLGRAVDGAGEDRQRLQRQPRGGGGVGAGRFVPRRPQADDQGAQRVEGSDRRLEGGAAVARGGGARAVDQVRQRHGDAADAADGGDPVRLVDRGGIGGRQDDGQRPRPEAGAAERAGRGQAAVEVHLGGV